MKPHDLPCDVVYAGREVLGELALAESREILVTNGIGGYASHTLAASLTRSYHGLLVAALRPPLDRTVLLAKLDDCVVYRARAYHLATDRRRAAAVRTQTATRCAHANFQPVPLDPTGNVQVRAGASLDLAARVMPVYHPLGSKTSPDVREGELVTPAGFELLESFRLEGTVPVFCYALADAQLEKRLWMKHGQNTVYVTYHLRRAMQAIQLRIKALVNHRNHHIRTSASHPHFSYSANVDRTGSAVSVLFVTPDHQETTLCMRLSGGNAHLTNEWVTGFVLSEERARGLPEFDDHLHPASFVVELPPGGHVTFVASAEPDAMHLSLDGDAELAMQHAYEKALLHKFENARDRAFQTRMAMAKHTSPSSWDRSLVNANLSPQSRKRRRRASVEPCIKQLVLAADQFIISRGGGRSVVAGFHWFTDWARDVRVATFYGSGISAENANLTSVLTEQLLSSEQTMISLPGLTIVTGRYDVARSILQTFSKYVSKGMLPNRFPDDGSAPTEADYNNADGTLWYFEAIRAYYMATGDLELLLELYPVLQAIVSHHCAGTRFGIIQDEDGLLLAGAEGLALTWMDAKTDIVYTPRDGKAVELAALWFNALHCMAFFAGELDDEDECDHFAAMADKTEQSFQERFWSHKLEYCYDVIDGGPERNVKDSSLRPNQLIAASLNWSPLTAEQRFLVVEACSTHLLTSNGIRTLSPDDKQYKGRYIGDIFSRDMSYHQGPAWVWLLGPFILAHLRALNNPDGSRDYLLPLLRSHLNDAGVGQISELFDGDPPNRARGCIAQAWSVAEVLRAWMATEPDDVFVQ